MQNPNAAGSGAHAPGGILASERVLRCFDLIVVVLLLPAALLTGSLIALAILLDSPGSVFYRSTRVGRDGKTFQMLKFRKMHHQAQGLALTHDDDERFTPIGRLLTVTKLDELPQLWNVLRGDMRLVGPRPEVPEFVAHYPEAYAEILTVTPGMTGMAALELADERHLYGPAEDPVAYYASELMPRKIEIDRAYVRRRTLHGDVTIILRTVTLPGRKMASQAVAGGAAAGAARFGFMSIAVLMLVVAFLSAGAVSG